MSVVTNSQNADDTQPQNDSAAVETQQYYQAILDKYNSGEITDDDIEKACEANDIDSSYILEYVHMTALEREEDSRYKSDLSENNGHKTIIPDDDYEALKNGDIDSIEIGDDCTITLTEKTVKKDLVGWVTETEQVYHVESDYLGTFDISAEDDSDYTIGYKEVTESDGSVSKLPVLKYIGSGDGASSSHLDALDFADAINGQHLISVPSGVKSLDYTYENSDLMYVPYYIPDGVTSIHCAFKDCEKLEAIGDNTITAGKKRNIYLPSTLEDASQAFENCTSLTCSVYSIDYSKNKSGWDSLIDTAKADMLGDYGEDIKDQLPESLVNATDMFNGCESMDDEYESGVWFWEQKGFLGSEGTYDTAHKANYGGELTPYLAPALARGIYDNISGEGSMINSESNEDPDYWKESDEDYVVDDDGQVNSKYADIVTSANEEAIEETKAAQFLLKSGLVESGHSDTSVEIATDGKLTNNKIRNEDGTYVYDATGRKKSYQVETKNSGAWWETLAIDGTTGLGLFGATDAIVTGLTGNNVLGRISGVVAGVGGIVGLEVKNVLPNSLYPVLTWTADKLPDGDFKNKLLEWADALPSAKYAKLNEDVNAYNGTLADYNVQWDDEFNLADANYEKRLTGLVDRAIDAQMDINTEDGIYTYMYNNAADCANELTFYAVAHNGEDSASCVTDTMNVALTARTESWKEEYPDASSITDEQKQEMADYYTSIMKALESYNTGAMENIDSINDSASCLGKVQIQGLQMTNRAYTTAVMESLQEMNSEYNFMTASDWEKITTLNIDGIDVTNLQNYNSIYFDDLKSSSKDAMATLSGELKSEQDAAESEETSNDTQTNKSLTSAFSSAESSTADNTASENQSEVTTNTESTVNTTQSDTSSRETITVDDSLSDETAVEFN